MMINELYTGSRENLNVMELTNLKKNVVINQARLKDNQKPYTPYYGKMIDRIS